MDASLDDLWMPASENYWFQVEAYELRGKVRYKVRVRFVKNGDLSRPYSWSYLQNDFGALGKETHQYFRSPRRAARWALRVLKAKAEREAKILWFNKGET